jgi:hypothetical protein
MCSSPKGRSKSDLSPSFPKAAPRDGAGYSGVSIVDPENGNNKPMKFLMKMTRCAMSRCGKAMEP